MTDHQIAFEEAMIRLLVQIKALPDDYQSNMVKELAGEFAEAHAAVLAHNKLVAKQVIEEHQTGDIE